MNSYRITYTTDNGGASTTTSVNWGDEYERIGLGDPKAAALRWADHLATRDYVTSVEVVELTHTTIRSYAKTSFRPSQGGPLTALATVLATVVPPGVAVGRRTARQGSQPPEER